MIDFDANLFLKEEKLSNYCTFKIGGSAKFLYVAKDTNTLLSVCKYCKSHNIKFKVIGLGANLLFDDLGYNGAIIINQTNNVRFNNNTAYVDSGVLVSSLIKKCMERSLSGLENLAGIPSTIGGGVVNSLGAFNTNLSDYVDYVECFKFDDFSTPIKLKKDECKFGYRTSVFKSNEYLITKVKYRFETANSTLIRERMLACLRKKKETQPLSLPSAGSVFKRSEIIPAKIIDELGFKGFKIGDAEISTKHAGFIVNLGNAKSDDVKQIISAIKNTVKQNFNIDLETEIEFVD